MAAAGFFVHPTLDGLMMLRTPRVLAAALAAVLFVGLPLHAAPKEEAHGKTLVAEHKVPEAVLQKFAAHKTSKPVQGESAVVNAMLADTEDWVAPEMATSSNSNPYTLVIKVTGRAKADGDVTSLWHAGWRFDDGATRLAPVAGMVAQSAKAGDVVTLVGKAPISFKEDRTLAPAIGLVKADNLRFDEVTVQVWSGVASSSFKDIFFSFPALFFGIVLLVVTLWLKRR
jgi:hypothetical protein